VRLLDHTQLGTSEELVAKAATHTQTQNMNTRDFRGIFLKQDFYCSSFYKYFNQYLLLEPAIPGFKVPQSYALDHAATGTGVVK
jgi:hypothetical protein